ncbi:MAG: hypothetical protein RL754_1065 [Bacteroidota bacterium]|jgi:intracellular sulfur oxidation DsrE/DsrF family protein
MKAIHTLRFAIIGLLMFGTQVEVQAQENTQHYVIMQLDSDRTQDQKATLSRIEALKAGWGEDVKIRLVVHGEGIALYEMAKTKHEAQIKELMEDGVQFVVCRKSMLNQELVPADLIGGVEMVQMGVKEIIVKQEGGWTYFRN